MSPSPLSPSPLSSRTAAGLVVLLGLAFSGCAEEEPADAAPPLTPSTSASSTAPDPEPTTPPAEPVLSPEETVRAWVAAHNATVGTGDDTEVRELSTSDCTSCDDLIQPIVDIYDAGGRMETKGWKVTAAERDARFAQNGEVPAAIIYLAGRTFATADSPPVTYSREKHIAIFGLEEVDDRWLVASIIYLS